MTLLPTIADIRRGDPAALLETVLARIARHDGELRVFTALDTAGARAAAAQSAARIANGSARPLEGVPIAIKANIAIAGFATTGGVAARRHAVAYQDAAVVTALRSAGAVILGHVNMHEAALGATTDNPAYGRTENPHRIGHTPGGSSGGSGAAVAAGLCSAALGTDTLGSVRIPAAYCGVVGLKPTYGLISAAGLVPLAARFDAIGPLARSVADLAAVLAALMPPGAPSAVTRVALLSAKDIACQPDVLGATTRSAASLAGLGITVTSVAAPGLDCAAARTAGFIVSAREAAMTFADDRSAGGISPTMTRLFDLGTSATPAALAAGEAILAASAAALHALLADHDAILTPTTPQTAFAHGRAPHNQADFTALANIAGLPALSLPAGVDGDGLPLAVQLIGRAGSEATLIALAVKLEPLLGGSPLPPGFD